MNTKVNYLQSYIRTDEGKESPRRTECVFFFFFFFFFLFFFSLASVLYRFKVYLSGREYSYAYHPYLWRFSLSLGKSSVASLTDDGSFSSFQVFLFQWPTNVFRLHETIVVVGLSHRFSAFDLLLSGNWLSATSSAIPTSASKSITAIGANIVRVFITAAVSLQFAFRAKQRTRLYEHRPQALFANTIAVFLLSRGFKLWKDDKGKFMFSIYSRFLRNSKYSGFFGDTVKDVNNRIDVCDICRTFR